MMKIAVQTGGPEERLGVDATYRLVKEAGFDAVDANIDHLVSGRDLHDRKIPEIFLTGSDKECAKSFLPWKEAAEKYGIDNYQAHAPFPSYVYDENNEEYNDQILTMLKRMIMGCDVMNCRNLIIHPFFLGYEQQLDPEKEWEINVDRYSRLIPEAKKYGVTINLENMFMAKRGKIYAACCSDITTACRYVDTLNGIAGGKQFGFCLDTGHLLLVGLDVKNAMIELGDRITAFHVHDNDGAHDQHLAPYMGVLDWNRFVEGLKAIGYNKTMSFETFNIWNVMDEEIAPKMMKFIAECGRTFARRAEA